MIHHTCFKCGRRMELDPVVVGIELRQLKVKKPTFYQAHCPACKSVNKVSVEQMKEELEAAAEEIERGFAEVQKAKKAAQEAARKAAQRARKIARQAKG